MKTTLDLPAELVKAMKLRAVHEGRKLKDVAAELLERGLSSPPTHLFPLVPTASRIEVQANGVPVIVCGYEPPASRMSTEELLALEQEALCQEDLERLGLSL